MNGVKIQPAPADIATDAPLPLFSEVAPRIRYFQFSSRANDCQILVEASTQFNIADPDNDEWFFLSGGLSLVGNPKASLRVDNCVEFLVGGGVLNVWLDHIEK